MVYIFIFLFWKSAVLQAVADVNNKYSVETLDIIILALDYKHTLACCLYTLLLFVFVADSPPPGYQVLDDRTVASPASVNSPQGTNNEDMDHQTTQSSPGMGIPSGLPQTINNSGVSHSG